MTKRSEPEIQRAVRPGRLILNAAWLTGGEVMSRLIAFFVSVYLARLFGAEGFGRIGAAIAFVAYFTVVVNAGLDPYATREVSRRPDGLPSIIGNVFRVRLVMAVLLYGVLTALILLLPDRTAGARGLALIFGGSLFARAVNAGSALRGRDEMRSVAAGLILQHLVYATVVFLFVRGTVPPILLVPVAFVSGELVCSTIYIGFLRRKYAPVWDTSASEEIRPMVRESVPVGASKALRLIYYHGDVLLVTWLSTAAAAGHFLASHKIVLSLAVLAQTYQVNAFPTLSRLMATALAPGLSFQRRVNRYALSLAVPVAVGGAFVAVPLIRLVFGQEYGQSALILSILLFTLPLAAVAVGLEHPLLATGRSGMVLWAELAGAVAHLGLALLWIPLWEARGAAAASLLGRAAVLLSLVFFWRVGFRSFPFTRQDLRILAAGGVMAAAMWLFRLTTPLLLGVVGGVVYILAVLTLRGVGVGELRALAADLRSETRTRQPSGDDPLS